MPRRLRGLDGLRGISIAVVIFGHLRPTVHPPNLPSPLEYPSAELGVEMFFVLSGFLITGLILRDIRGRGFSFRQFFVRRAYRIWPAWYAFVATLVILTVLGKLSRDRPTPLMFLSGIFYVWNMSPFANNNWWLGHSWSLSIEEQFYLLWPLALGPLLRLGRALSAAVAVILISPAIRVVLYFAIPSLRGHLPILAISRADALMFGCAVALSIGTDNYRRVANWIRRYHLAWLAAAFMLFLETPLEKQFGGTYFMVVGYTMQGLCYTAILIAVLESPRSLGVSVLQWKPIVFVGRISYSLYLWQQLFCVKPSLHPPAFGSFPANLIATFVCAVASALFIERPFLALRDRNPGIRETSLDRTSLGVAEVKPGGVSGTWKKE